MIPELYVTYSHCRLLQPGKFNGMSSQSHVSCCRVLPLGEFTIMFPEPHPTLQGVRIPSAMLKIVFCRILFYFCFLKCSLGFDERRLSYRLRYTCFIYEWAHTLYNISLFEWSEVQWFKVRSWLLIKSQVQWLLKVHSSCHVLIILSVVSQSLKRVEYLS